MGIAEQHALTMAAGMALQGYHPVVALYATFLNRGFDQMLMDVALHGAPVTIILDRAGITGDDGASHNGMWDLSLAAMIPGMRTAAPRDGERLRALVREAVAIDSPTLVRYPKGVVPEEIVALRSVDGIDVLFESEIVAGVGLAADKAGPSRGVEKVAVVAVGAMAGTALAAAKAAIGVAVTVVDPRWVLPVSEGLVSFLSGFDRVVTLEDGLIDGGVGSEIEIALARARHRVPVAKLGVRREFIVHASRGSVLARENMTVDDARALIEGK